jgi:hypothetical protein
LQRRSKTIPNDSVSSYTDGYLHAGYPDAFYADINAMDSSYSRTKNSGDLLQVSDLSDYISDTQTWMSQVGSVFTN